MKWLKKIRESQPVPAPKPTAVEETRREALRIEELEARIAPNATWGD